MARQKQTQEHKDLEDELRNMILGNVRMSSNDNRPSYVPGRGRGAYSHYGHQQPLPHHRHAAQHQEDGAGRQNGNFENQKPSPSAHAELRPFPQRQNLDRPYGGRGGRGNRSSGTNSHFPQRPHTNSTTGNDLNHPVPSKPLTDSTAVNQPQLLQRPPGLQQLSPPGLSNAVPPAWPRNHMQPKPIPMAAFIAQCELLDNLAAQEIPQVEMSHVEFLEKEAFRASLEYLCRQELSTAFPELTATLNLRAYGSLVSGFATQGSDVDLTILWSGTTRDDPEFKAQLPRVVENAILRAGHGGRLLSRTRVPIIKVCERPSEELLVALKEEREKWEQLPEEEKYPELHPQAESPVVEPSSTPAKETTKEENNENPQLTTEIDPEVSRSGKKMETTKRVSMNEDAQKFLEQLAAIARTEDDDLLRYCTQFINARRFAMQNSHLTDEHYANTFLRGFPQNVADEIVQAERVLPIDSIVVSLFDRYYDASHAIIARIAKARGQKKEKPWIRERALGKLDYPKTGVGIQCDINFSNPLGMHNTELLRLYSLCDPRVRPMILFLKAWTKRRKINSAYNGTLSSYGYVLLALHYFINVVQPPILPNLQHVYGATSREILFEGWNVSFYADEAHIRHMAATNQWTSNTQPLGVLLRNFLHYYAAQGPQVLGGGFNWMKDVVSIRTPRGIMSKEYKGWTGAKTVQVEGREVRQRYLLAIEDPFEIDHNVGRPVTHNGIVTIRDEFRRAWRILQAVGRGSAPEGGLFDHVVEDAKDGVVASDKARITAQSAPTESNTPVIATSQ